MLDRVLFLWFFLSGASGLIYEVVWLRWLVHVFGATTLAISTILAAFMGGLALGSWLGGRYARRIARPLLAYGFLEVAIAAYAFALPWLLDGVVPVLRSLGATGGSSYPILSLARFALAVVLLALPTACMGATLPILAQFAAPRLESLGGRVGRLYAVNTAGAVVGTAVAGLALLPALGTAATNLVAVALNLAVGLTAAIAGRAAFAVGAPLAATPDDATAPREPASTPAPVSPEARRLAGWALATVALSGAVAMIYEVGWSRALALVLGSSVYAFTIMLTTFLVGIAGGSYLLARRVDRLREPGLTLGAVQLASAVTAFLGLAVVAELPYLFLRIYGWSGGRHALLLALEFVITGALILLPALCSGAVFPLCVRLTASSGARIGRSVGNLYALNTVGAIVGSFLGGFVLIPTVGIRGSLLVGVLLNLACAFGLFLALPARRARIARPVAFTVPLLALALPVVAPDWKPLTMASGVAVAAPTLHRFSRAEFQERRAQARLLFYEEGLTTTVSVEARGDLISLRVNGKTDASTGADMPNQVLAGQLPLLLHPDGRDVLIVGLGSGVTVGSVLTHPVRAVTVVELERAVVTGSHFFDHVNFRPLDDPRTRLVVNDARNYLLLTRERFDIIVSEPSNPWLTGAASLFTRDSFELARARLRPGGVMSQWVQLYGLTPELFRTVVATFASVFPHTVVFHSSLGDTVLVGSETPFRVDHATLLARIAAPRVAQDLQRIEVRDLPDLFARLVLDVEDVPRFTRGAILNTDDNAHVEFTAPRTLYVDAIGENALRLADAFRGGALLAAVARGGAEDFLPSLAERLLDRARPQQVEAVARLGLETRPRADLLRAAARAAAARGETAEADKRFQAALRLDPDDPEVLLELAAHRAALGELRDGLALVRRAAPRGGPRAALLEADLLLRLGALREADARLGVVPLHLPGALVLRGRARLAHGDAAGAEPLFRDALAAGDDPGARAGLAAALDLLGRTVEARRERERALRLDAEAGARLRSQARLHAAIGHLRWAAHALDEAAGLLPWDLGVHVERARLLERLGDRRAAIDAWLGIAAGFPRHAIAHLEVGVLREAQGDLAGAREALRRYLAAERDPALRRKAEAALARLPAPP